MKTNLFILLVAAIPTLVEAGSADKLAETNVAALHELMQPKKEELIWKDSIPWRTDLWEARREAAAAGKPIYLWEMDGHPLGCT
jgi:hypothetical protein